MYHIILNIYKQLDTAKAKLDADLLNLALSALKQLKITNYIQLNKYKYNSKYKYKLLLHTHGEKYININ